MSGTFGSVVNPIRIHSRRDHLKALAVGRWRAALYEAAHEACLDWARSFPDDFEAACLLAWCSMRVDAPDALPDAAFERATELANDSDRNQCLEMGSLAHAHGRSEAALQWFARAAACTPATTEPWLRSGAILMHQERHDSAASHFRQALAVTPNDARAHAHLAFALRRLGDFETAIVHLRTAISLTPDRAEFHNNLGSLLAAVGSREEAAREFEVALQLRPVFPEAHANLRKLQSG